MNFLYILLHIYLFYVQDCSDMRQDGLTNANPHNTNENFGEGSIN